MPRLPEKINMYYLSEQNTNVKYPVLSLCEN